ncbi:hypothetical protein CONLIGDRAFT_685755 [Coniochaeta ligniaria NRRL 30616]|uniref:Uncharacterized protein n=1 Tax=Coniochaeta ligniaria NRRL 30616 TaxID=1408157 RepID=A0A1J7J9C6_9PEZI|nr:hypothetical protein CONLIGDRAFT_685755 [Coniochaeta ligniaria NRRL 30616]
MAGPAGNFALNGMAFIQGTPDLGSIFGNDELQPPITHLRRRTSCSGGEAKPELGHIHGHTPEEVRVAQPPGRFLDDFIRPPRKARVAEALSLSEIHRQRVGPVRLLTSLADPRDLERWHQAPKTAKSPKRGGTKAGSYMCCTMVSLSRPKKSSSVPYNQPRTIRPQPQPPHQFCLPSSSTSSKYIPPANRAASDQLQPAVSRNPKKKVSDNQPEATYPSHPTV